MTEDFVAAAHWLKARPESNGKLGVVGFCFGGGIVNTLAVAHGRISRPRCRSTVRRPRADVPKIKAAVLAHHAELDTRLASAWPAYDAALTAAGVRTRATSTRRPITASTTTRRRGTTKRPRSSRGSAPWTGSTSTCGSVVQTLLKIGDGVLERGHALLERDALGARRGRAFDEVVQGDAERARERNGEEQTGIVRLIALDP